MGANDSFIGEELGLEGRGEIQKAKRRRVGRVLSREDCTYKLAGMKENGIFEEQQELWWGIVGRGRERRVATIVDNTEQSEVVRKIK